MFSTIADTLAAVDITQASSHGSNCSSDDELQFSLPFRKPESDIARWVGAVDHDDNVPAEAPSAVDEYQVFIKQSAAYQWLLSAIQQSWQLEIPGRSNAFNDLSQLISGGILSQAAARKVSSHAGPAIIDLKVRLDWDPVVFVRQQKYDVEPGKVLDRIICLTGTWDNAYASTPLDYLKQVWPLTYKPLYGLVKNLLDSGASKSSCKCISLALCIRVCITNKMRQNR